MLGKRRKDRDAEAAAALVGLREFNARGLEAIVRLTAAAEAMERRIAALEAFQRELQAPADKRDAN